jgi:hypothetical protein
MSNSKGAAQLRPVTIRYRECKFAVTLIAEPVVISSQIVLYFRLRLITVTLPVTCWLNLMPPITTSLCPITSNPR